MYKNETKIPQCDDDVEKILCKQIALLAEESQKYKDEPEILINLSLAMASVSETLFSV